MRPHRAAAALVVGVLAASAASWVAHHQPPFSPGRCEMTFMYSSFVRVPLPPSSASASAPGAATAAEGGTAEDIISSGGNGGSYDLYLYREDGFVEQSCV